MERQTIQYHEGALVIMIPTSDPAELHSQLLQSITQAMRYSTASTDKSNHYPDEMLPLFNLLSSILPGEKVLSRGGL